MADIIPLGELTERTETAKAITDPAERRVELHAIYGTLTEYRLAIIEQHLGIAHAGLDELLQALSELNASFRAGGEHRR
ncbi:MAG: hypothetical protein OXC00_14390 [Acidimicrobiaceae bacterium]|nr:hypothetical protein [Acidimicrobiaceae bacterium]